MSAHLFKALQKGFDCAADLLKEWNDAKHPRGKRGQFTSKLTDIGTHREKMEDQVKQLGLTPEVLRSATAAYDAGKMPAFISDKNGVVVRDKEFGLLLNEQGEAIRFTNLSDAYHAWRAERNRRKGGATVLPFPEIEKLAKASFYVL